jgi:hypothetical protein
MEDISIIGEQLIYHCCIGYKFGSPFYVNIIRNGDACNKYILSITLPELFYDFEYIDNIGNEILDYVELFIGGQNVQKFDGDYLRAVCNPSFREGNKILIVLPFDLCVNTDKNIGIPLICLNHHEVRIEGKLRDIYSLVYSKTKVDYNKLQDLEIKGMDIHINYLYLDDEYRRKISKMSHLTHNRKINTVEQIIDKDDIQKNKIKLNVSCPKLPFTELILLITDPLVDQCKDTSEEITNEHYSNRKFYQYIKNISIEFGNYTIIDLNEMQMRFITPFHENKKINDGVYYLPIKFNKQKCEIGESRIDLTLVIDFNTELERYPLLLKIFVLDNYNGIINEDNNGLFQPSIQGIE